MIDIKKLKNIIYNIPLIEKKNPNAINNFISPLPILFEIKNLKSNNNGKINPNIFDNCIDLF